MHVYLITCTKNGKAYVGCTVRDNLNRYFRQKMSDARTRSKPRGIPLYHAFRKYGTEAFAVQSLCRPTSVEQMHELEKMFIEIYRTRDRRIGYNVTAGGEGLPGMKFSAEHKAKISQALKGKRNLPIGFKHTDEHNQQLSAKMIGNKYSLGRKPSGVQQAALTANSFANKTPEEFSRLHEMAMDARRKVGWVVTEDHKKKISASTKGKPKSEVTKQRMREAFLARTTPEQRRAMSRLANETRWAKERGMNDAA